MSNGFTPVDGELTLTLEGQAVGSIANNLTTDVEGYALDARQGKVLDEKKLDVSKVMNNRTTVLEGYALDARQGKWLDENKVGFADVANDLTTEDKNKVLSAAQGAALVSMVCELTIPKEKFAEYKELCEEVKAEILGVYDALVIGIDKDTESFNEVMKAIRLPKDTKEQIEYLVKNGCMPDEDGEVDLTDYKEVSLNDLTLDELSSLVDIFYIGGTKNGALLGEAIVINNEKLKGTTVQELLGGKACLKKK